MQNSQSPLLQLADVDAVQLLNALPQSDARASFRTLLPIIDELVQRGVSYAAIAAALEKAGITMKAASIRQARCRWRKQRPKAAMHTVPAAHYAPPAAAAVAPAPSRPQAAGAITSKADLVQLRKSAGAIDLNLLAELGRQK